MNCLLIGYDNYCDGNLVAYHYESQTRNEDPENMNKLQQDYIKNLYPFFLKNFDKLKKHITIG